MALSSPSSRRAGQQGTAPLRDDVLPDLGRLLRGDRRYRLVLKRALGARNMTFKQRRCDGVQWHSYQKFLDPLSPRG